MLVYTRFIISDESPCVLSYSIKNFSGKCQILFGGISFNVNLRLERTTFWERSLQHLEILETRGIEWFRRSWKLPHNGDFDWPFSTKISFSAQMKHLENFNYFLGCTMRSFKWNITQTLFLIQFEGLNHTFSGCCPFMLQMYVKDVWHT